MPLPRETVLREGPVCTVVRVEAPGAPTLYEKRYRVAWPWLPLRGLFKGNMPALDARVEAENVLRVRALGIETPGVSAVRSAWRWSGLSRVHESEIVLEEAPGIPLDLALRTMDAIDRRRVARHLGSIVRSLHAASIYHRDLYLCHVFHDPVRERLTLIDLARAAPRRMLRARFRAKDLAALFLSSRGLVTHGDVAAFLRAYFGVLGALPEEARAVTRRAVAKAASLARHGMKG